MERKEFIVKLNILKFVAHRLGYAMTKYPENSLKVLEEIFADEELLDACYGFEFDICFTKDNIPVVIHDKYIDDISDSFGLIKKHTLSELKKINLSFRKSLGKNNNLFVFKIVTLEEILSFFVNNIDLLKNKTIKIESKNPVFINKNCFRILAHILNSYSSLNKNIVHLSFWPQNLSVLKKIQKQQNYDIVTNDLLCDYDFLVFLSKYFNFLDNVSLRIKSKTWIGKCDKNNSFLVNFKIKWDLFWMNFSNAISEKTIKHVIDRYGIVGLYILNGENEIDEFCKNISDNFFERNYNKMVFTTNNPILLKKIK